MKRGYLVLVLLTLLLTLTACSGTAQRLVPDGANYRISKGAMNPFAYAEEVEILESSIRLSGWWGLQWERWIYHPGTRIIALDPRQDVEVASLP